MSRWSRVLAAFAFAVFSTVVYSTASFQDAAPPFVVRTLPPDSRQGAGVVDEEADEGFSRGLGRGFNVRSFVAKTQPPVPPPLSSAASRRGRPAAVSKAAPASLSDQRSQHAVVLVDVPHGGGRSVACTFGNLRRWLGAGDTPASSGAAQLRERIELVSVGEGGGLRRALDTPSGFGVQKGVLHVSPNATYVVVFPLRHPVDRVVASFVARGGAGWPCADGLPGYGDAEPSTSEGRQQQQRGSSPVTCEDARNVLLKRLLGLPAGEPATVRHLEKAKALLRSERLVIGNEEDLPKTMEHLRSVLGRPAPMRYYNCTAYRAPPEPSRSVRDALYDENRLDVQLYEAARHRFYTGFAGRFEQLYTVPATPCLLPHACWVDEVKPDGRRAEPRVKPFASAKYLKSPYCAAECTT